MLVEVRPAESDAAMTGRRSWAEHGAAPRLADPCRWLGPAGWSGLVTRSEGQTGNGCWPKSQPALRQARKLCALSTGVFRPKRYGNGGRRRAAAGVTGNQENTRMFTTRQTRADCSTHGPGSRYESHYCTSHRRAGRRATAANQQESRQARVVGERRRRPLCHVAIGDWAIRPKFRAYGGSRVFFLTPTPRRTRRS